MIRFQNVYKEFNTGKPNAFIAVNGVSCHMESNRVTVLKGPSGSGKTTILSLLGCMTRPTSGRITLKKEVLGENGFLKNGDDREVEVSSLPERFLTEIRRKSFGFIFQQFNLIRGISVIENVLLPLYPIGLNHKTAVNRAESLLDLFGILGRERARVEWLSGGEAQRVAIARALINDPAVIVADEPTAHLDSGLSREFMDIISRLKDRGKTTIIASHDPLVYGAAVVDRVLAVRDGKIGEDHP